MTEKRSEGWERKQRDNYVYCTVCGRPKKPIGRDSRDNGLCQHDCEGYRLEPLPSSYWPGDRTNG